MARTAFKSSLFTLVSLTALLALDTPTATAQEVSWSEDIQVADIGAASVVANLPASAVASSESDEPTANSGVGQRLNKTFSPNFDGSRSGFTELLPYALPSPDQKEAGSCLYMSLTGIAEWWLARLNPQTSRTLDGPLDLSERWLMNAAGDSRSMSGVREWKTDSVYIFNNIREMALNAAYRFTMGWFTGDYGDYTRSREGVSGAEYGEQFNWIDDRTHAGRERVQLPRFERTVLFAKPGADQWDVGIAPDTLVEQIKTALLTHRAPVQVLYNHLGYWHATVILGFDDQKSTSGCRFVERSRAYFKSAEGLSKNRQTTNDLEDSVRRRGACNPRGIFYVRDSIYGDNRQPQYVYDPNDLKRGVGRYSAKFVELEYAFVTHLSNHAIQITAKAN